MRKIQKEATIMTKQEILAKVNELIAAPSVCASVKKAAEAYAKNQDKGFC